MFDPHREKPSGDYLLRATAILKSIAAGKRMISELSQATALPVTTIMRTAAILVDDHILAARIVGDDVELTMIRGQSSLGPIH